VASLPSCPACLRSGERINAIFDVQCEINGRSIDERLTVRRERVAPLVCDLETWIKLSRHSDVAKVIDYMRKRCRGFHSTNIAEETNGQMHGKVSAYRNSDRR
jgi:transposase